MGLDMYLNARRHLWSWNEDDKAEQKRVAAIRKAFPEIDKESKPSSVIVEVAYWRKANAIHKWMVENCQDGEDQCQTTYVSKDDLRPLHELIKKILKDNSLGPKLLPTSDGFFFGGTGYDQWYIRQLEYTNKRFDILLKEDAMPDWSYEYRASW